MQFHGNSNIGTRINVAKLILQESGTYNPMFSRPYQTHIAPDVLQSIVRRVEETPGNTITANTLAGSASSIIQPSATAGSEITIPMSWTERRIRFLMEVHVTMATGNMLIYYFQGYTSHLGVSNGGHIDPSMDFILNSYIRVSRGTAMTPYGLVTEDKVTESAHIVNGNIVHQQASNDMYMMRPQDIFSGIQSAYLGNAYTAFEGDKLHDFRAKLSGESVMSNRNNNVSGQYLARVIETYNNGRNLLEFGQRESEISGRCYELTKEQTPFENVFIRAISNVRGMHTSTSFRYNDLKQIDPNIDNVTDYLTLGGTVATQMHNVGQTEYWSGSNRETLGATILSNAVPALMMELFITKIYFRTTNHTHGGIPNTVLIDAKSLTTADMSANFKTFLSRLEHEIMFDISSGGHVSYVIEMQVDLFGETRISIGLDSGPMISYTTPSFCDSLLTPVIAQNSESYYNVVHDMETLFNHLPSANNGGFSPSI